MEKKVIIEASEQELTDIINLHFNTDLEGFVAMEELGNEVITRDVSHVRWDTDAENVREMFEFKRDSFKHYILQDLLDHMCFVGALEEGTYLIDCTW